MTGENMKDFVPQCGMVVYKRHTNYFLQVHEIRPINGKLTWCEGKSFEKEQLQELAMALRKENLSSLQCQGLLPENVLYYQPSISGNKFIWWIPAGEQHLNFNNSMKLKSGKCKLPALIFAVDDKDVSVFAFKGKEKPGPKTQLFQAPFYNLNQAGEVCLGTTSETRKKGLLHEEISRWERRFFGSNFTGHHFPQLAKGWTMKDLYQKILAGQPFPEKSLKESTYKTLEAFAKEFTR